MGGGGVGWVRVGVVGVGGGERVVGGVIILSSNEIQILKNGGWVVVGWGG